MAEDNLNNLPISLIGIFVLITCIPPLERNSTLRNKNKFCHPHYKNLLFKKVHPDFKVLAMSIIFSNREFNKQVQIYNK